MPGVIPLIPGVGLSHHDRSAQSLRGARRRQKTLVAIAAVNSFKTALIIGAIAISVAIPSLIFRRRRPMT